MKTKLIASWFSPWGDAPGGEWVDQILAPDDIITVTRSVRAFNVSQPTPTPQTMTVREALNSGALDTHQGTMVVSAAVEFEDGTTATVSKEK